MPTYLARTERFMWQQARDLPHVRIVTLELTPTATEFPFSDLSVLRPQQRWTRSADYRSRKLAHRLGFQQLRLTPIELARSVRLMRDADLAFTMFLWNAFDLLLPSKLARIPLVVHAAGSDVTTARSRGAEYLALVHSVLDRAELVLCGSIFLREKVIELGCRPEKCEVHYLGIDIPQPFERIDNDGDETLVVTTISRLHRMKGVDYSMMAFARSLGGTSARLIVVGNGPERLPLAQLANDLGIGTQVVFEGEQSHDRVYEILQETDILLQHNITMDNGAAEGLGGTLLEASAHFVPVIATTSGGAPEAVIDGKTGFVIEEGNIDAMAERLTQLASDPMMRAKVGNQGREFVEISHNSALQNRGLRTRLEAVTAT